MEKLNHFQRKKKLHLDSTYMFLDFMTRTEICIFNLFLYCKVIVKDGIDPPN